MKKPKLDRAMLVLVSVLGIVALVFSRPVEDVSATLAAGRRFHGKGMWIWKWRNAVGGDIEQVIRRCKDAKVNLLLIKVNDGREVIAPSGEAMPVEDLNTATCQLTKEIVDRLHAAGIAVHGWSMTYGGDVQKEIEFGIWALHDLGSDGFVFDAEGHIKNKFEAAAEISSGVRQHIEDCGSCQTKRLAFSSYRNPGKHPSLPYEEFAANCDTMMPQCYYWYPESKSDPKQLVAESFGQWLRLEGRLHDDDLTSCHHQIIPVGQTMYGAPPEKIIELMEATKRYHGHCFWKWEDTSKEQWQAIKGGPSHQCSAQCQ